MIMGSTPEPEEERIPSGMPEGEIATEEEPWGASSPVEMLLPPMTLLIFILAGLICLSLTTQRKWWKLWLGSFKRKKKLDSSGHFGIGDFLPKNKVFCTQQSKNGGGNGKKSLFDESDWDCIDSFNVWQNNPKDILKISAPALMSLGLCPIALFMYEPLLSFYWSKKDFASPPRINDVIQCFLAPAGLVYAIAFGFAFQEAVSKQRQFSGHLTNMLTLMRQMIMLTMKMRQLANERRRKIFHIVKNAVLDWMEYLAYNKNEDSIDRADNIGRAGIWNIMNILQENSEILDDKRDASLFDDMLSLISQMDKMLLDYDRKWHRRIHPLQWVFLEFLAFFSFFGILFIRAYSYRLELTMCILTVFSISLFCYVLADYDSPYHGFFRVDLSVLSNCVIQLDEIYQSIGPDTKATTTA